MENHWEISGNFWNKEAFSYEEALEASKTLQYCENCVNCEDCIAYKNDVSKAACDE